MKEILEKIQAYLPFSDQTDTWIIQIFLIVFIALLIDLFQKKILRRVKKQLQKTENLWDDALIHAIIRPISLLIWTLGLSLALELTTLEIGRAHV